MSCLTLPRTTLYPGERIGPFNRRAVHDSRETCHVMSCPQSDSDVLVHDQAPGWCARPTPKTENLYPAHQGFPAALPVTPWRLIQFLAGARRSTVHLEIQLRCRSPGPLIRQDTETGYKYAQQDQIEVPAWTWRRPVEAYQSSAIHLAALVYLYESSMKPEYIPWITSTPQEQVHHATWAWANHSSVTVNYSSATLRTRCPHVSGKSGT
ncbi:hypothetical protein BJ138DRAFT_660477 [Hygrophoropsis aurantiaca]|uniref:Uncharacterized protein n=1 Tax=Hygrophoropsis aurantiaca TaxID=72124 RepID=A0ACB7ZZB2_9AGAM|nr:hypothetical protein BJ138DRAFT_660477 [Hygrophoropsis aurantiaca]